MLIIKLQSHSKKRLSDKSDQPKRSRLNERTYGNVGLEMGTDEVDADLIDAACTALEATRP